MNEKDFIELYRHQVENRDEAPPETCWDEISTQLDVEETWDSISMELDNVLPLNNLKGELTDTNQVIFTRLALLISSLVIILLIMLSDARKTDLRPSEISATDVPAPSVDQSVVLQSPTAVTTRSEQPVKETKAVPKDILIQEPGNIETTPLLSEPPIIYKGEPIPIFVSPVSDPETGIPAVGSSPVDETVTLTNRNFNNPVNPIIINPDQLIPQADVLIPSGNVTGIEPDKNVPLSAGRRQILNKFSIGISLTEKNTWMINQETIDGLDRQQLNTTKAKFLNDFGIILRYTPGERWSFEGSSFLLSKTGQSYKQYLNGIYSTKIYELKYYSFEMSARYALRTSLNISNVKSYPVAGAYISFLNYAHKTINQSLSDVSADYNPVDFGLILGYELEIKILNRFAVTPGIRIKYGIPNIFADQPGIPAELHATRNASLEFRLNLLLPLSNF
jgi:hypothetical protein